MWSSWSPSAYSFLSFHQVSSILWSVPPNLQECDLSIVLLDLPPAFQGHAQSFCVERCALVHVLHGDRCVEQLHATRTCRETCNKSNQRGKMSLEIMVPTTQLGRSTIS